MRLSMQIRYLGERFGIEKACEMVKAAGFDAGDYGLNTLTDDAAPFNSSEWQDVAKRIRAGADAAGLEINQTHAPFTFGKRFCDEEARKNIIIPRTVRALEISGILGADTVIVHPLHFSEYRGHEEEWFERNMEFYRQLIPHAKANGVKICVENMWRNDPVRKYIIEDTCSSAEEFNRYIDTLDSEYIGGCLDIGHVVLVRQDDTPADFIRKMGGKRLCALHVHDNDCREDLHTIPYMGLVNWEETAKALGEIDYQGDFTYETILEKNIAHMSNEALPIGIKFMADVGRYLMSVIDRNRP